MKDTARINIHIPKDIHRNARLYCVAHGRTMAEVVVEALVRLLEEHPNAKPEIGR